MQNISISSKSLNIIISFFAAILFFQIMSLLTSVTQGHSIYWFFHVFGGGSGGIVYLKMTMYTAFTFGLLELWEQHKLLLRENEYQKLDILPRQDQQVLLPAQVEDIKLNIIRLEQSGLRYVMMDFTKKATTQFRNNLNISDTIQVLDGEFDSTQTRHEGNLEMVRYLIQTVPMLGFIGTIVELTSALQLIGTGSLKDLENVRMAMSGAFDATVVALTLTMVLTYFYHRYIGQLDMFFGEMKSFIYENLISRIYQKPK